MDRDAVYMPRFVAFIDILGFTNHVEKTAVSQSDAVELYQALKKLERIVKIHGDTRSQIGDAGERMTVFSDSIVISQLADDSSALHCLLLSVAQIQLELLGHGYVVRGGISFGLMHHEGALAFGPALIEAYKLAENIAVYPRVIIHEDTLSIACRLHSANGFRDVHKELYALVCNDEYDNWMYYIDYLRQEDEFDWSIDYIRVMKRTRDIILDNLNNHQINQRVKQKYLWLKCYYNRVCKGCDQPLSEYGVVIIHDEDDGTYS